MSNEDFRSNEASEVFLFITSCFLLIHLSISIEKTLPVQQNNLARQNPHSRMICDAQNEGLIPGHQRNAEHQKHTQQLTGK